MRFRFLAAFFFLSMMIAAADMPQEEMADVFVRLLYSKKTSMSPASFDVSESKGIRKMKWKGDSDNIRTLTYTYDAKNYYLRREIGDEQGSSTAEAGVYFRNDKTAIIAVSEFANAYMVSNASSNLTFTEYRCDKNSAEKCPGKNVTAEVFPAIDSSLFLANEPNAEDLAKVLLLYKVPQIGTTISVTPAVSFTQYRTLKAHERKALVKKYFKHTKCQVNWNKPKEKFELGKCVSDPSHVQSLFEN